MRLSQALEIFYSATLADGKADATLKWYQQRLSRLLQFLGNAPIESITIDDLRRFMVHLRQADQKWTNSPFRPPTEGSLSPATLHSYVRAIKRLFNWLEEEGHITTAQNPAIRLKKPRLPKAAPKEVTIEDIRKLIEAAKDSKQFADRDRAIILFLTVTGCRVAGLVGLKLSDVDLEKRRAYVTEKGSKGRYVFFGQADTGSSDRMAPEAI